MSADQRRFERLVGATRDDLLAYALRRTASPEDAADVLAETYLIAWRKLPHVPPGDQARLWLFGVARNVIRRSVQRRRSDDLLHARLAREVRAVAHIDAASADLRTTAALRGVLATLTARDRELLMLTAWEGLTPQEIGTVLGMPANVVRVRLHRARKRVAHRLQAATRPERGTMIDGAPSRLGDGA